MLQLAKHSVQGCKTRHWSMPCLQLLLKYTLNIAHNHISHWKAYSCSPLKQKQPQPLFEDVLKLFSSQSNEKNKSFVWEMCQYFFHLKKNAYSLTSLNNTTAKLWKQTGGLSSCLPLYMHCGSPTSLNGQPQSCPRLSSGNTWTNF